MTVEHVLLAPDAADAIKSANGSDREGRSKC
jgi:hypothetical protein